MALDYNFAVVAERDLVTHLTDELGEDRWLMNGELGLVAITDAGFGSSLRTTALADGHRMFDCMTWNDGTGPTPSSVSVHLDVAEKDMADILADEATALRTLVMRKFESDLSGIRHFDMVFYEL